MCGNLLNDCSCSSSCKQRGNCCSDYDTINCETIFDKASKAQNCDQNQGCQFCDNLSQIINGVPKCNQCTRGLYLHEGKCYNSCPNGYIGETTNFTCAKKIETCLVDNCSVCVNGNPAVCQKCERGQFLYNNICHQICPEGFRADRITWTCLEAPIFAWYWVYPSRTSCRTHCGHVIQEDWDCSCAADCFRYGNCCQDIEDVCNDLLFWRKKAISNLNKKSFLKKIK